MKTRPTTSREAQGVGIIDLRRVNWLALAIRSTRQMMIASGDATVPITTLPPKRARQRRTLCGALPERYELRL